MGFPSYGKYHLPKYKPTRPRGSSFVCVNHPVCYLSSLTDVTDGLPKPGEPKPWRLCFQTCHPMLCTWPITRKTMLLWALLVVYREDGGCCSPKTEPSLAPRLWIRISCWTKRRISARHSWKSASSWPHEHVQQIFDGSRSVYCSFSTKLNKYAPILDWPDSRRSVNAAVVAALLRS